MGLVSACSHSVINTLWLILLLIPTQIALGAGAQTRPYKEVINALHRGPAASGANATVVQVEAPGSSPDGETSRYHYAPDLSNPNFSKLTVHLDPQAKTSAHSDTVAALFYGRRRSISNGIQHAWVYSAGSWSMRLANWNLQPDNVAKLFPGPVVNHSWVASHPLAARNRRLLRRLDYSAITNNVLHVYGVRRKGNGEALFASAFNGLSAGGAALNITQSYPDIDKLYAGARYRPEIVAPYPHSSAATAIVSAAAVRLNALAAILPDIPSASYRESSQALPVELVKALLLAGAKGDFVYAQKNQSADDYQFGDEGLAPNGLDKRYGMGMLNVGMSERILKSGSSATSGYSFVRPVDNANSATRAVYPLAPDRDSQLVSSLVWLMQLTPTGGGQLAGNLPNLDLCLVDVSDGEKVVAESKGTFDTTENLRVNLRGGHKYELRVLNGDDKKIDVPFALAWRY